MKRITTIEIGGKEYPMKFSIEAMKAICEKYGSLENMVDVLGKSDYVDIVDAILWIEELLIRQGCAYKNEFEHDVPPETNSPIVDGKYVPLTAEQLALGIDMADIAELKVKIFETMGLGRKNEISVKAKDDKKNDETT